MAGPLRGITVLEIASFIAGPYAGALLADLGRKSSKSRIRMAATHFAVVAELRWRKTWPTSASRAPPRSIWVAAVWRRA